MAKEIKVQETIQSDFSVVVNDIAEELLTRLNMDEDGSVIDMFQTGSFDPWQLFVFFGALEKALIEFRTDKRKKTVIVHACIDVSFKRHERRPLGNRHAHSIC